jgi:simple sugar transport system permease protein
MSTLSHPPGAQAGALSAAASGGSSEHRDRRYRLHQSGIDVAILAAVCLLGSVVYAVVRPDDFAFLTHANLTTAMQTIPFLGIPALGVGLLMIAGEFDLSIGPNYVFSSIVMAQLTTVNGMNVWLAAVLGLAIGTGIGLLNGVITLRLRIPSFITTLGTAGIWSAGILLVHGASSQVFAPSNAFADVTTNDVAGIPVAFIWFIVLAVMGWALLQRHRLGNHIFAAGGNPQAAIATGVRVPRAKFVAFALTGLCAAFAGILAASSTGDVSPTEAADLPLQAIAACVIGGVLLMGGRGTILGIFLGACLIYWIQDVLLLGGAPGYYLSAFVGALVITAAVLYQTLQARRL